MRSLASPLIVAALEEEARMIDRSEVSRAVAKAPMNVPAMRHDQTNANGDTRQSAELRLVEPAVPNAENGTFRPKRVTNAERRPREHLSRDEVLTLCKAARSNRYGARDAAAIWLAFNHG